VSVAEPRGIKPFLALLDSEKKKSTFSFRSFYVGNKKALSSEDESAILNGWGVSL
jgi:hypothetical protein